MNLRFKLLEQVHYQVVLEPDPRKIEKGVFGKQSGMEVYTMEFLEFNNFWIFCHQ